MNARQTKKHLKKQIDKLRSDKDLMRSGPKIQDCTTIALQELKVKREIPAYTADLEGFIEYAERAMAKELFNGIRESITYEVDANCNVLSITASIFVGRKRGMI